MAHSIFHRPAIPRPAWSWDDVTRATRLRRNALVRSARYDPRLFLWNATWLPFWIGSEAALPRLPSREPRAVPQSFTEPAGNYLASRADKVVRNFGLAWLAGSLLRGLTLALLVLTCWALLAVVGLVGLPGWGMVIGIGLGGLAIGAVYAWLIWPDRLMLATMLDRTFGLQERIVTAFDRPADASHVSRLQLADAANTFDEIMTEVPRSAYLPIREAAICLIVAGALVTMLLAYVPHSAIATVSDSPVPQFVPASERLAVRESVPPPQPPDQPTADNATIAEIQERGRRSQSARDDLARLGEALQDHALTQPAAEAIASGDYASAADSLRDASKAASTMSPDARNALADDLEQSAQEMSESNPELAQAAQDAADALREGGPGAETALSELADQVDETSQQIESQDDLSRELDEAQSGSGGSSSDEQSTSQEQQGGSSESSAGNQEATDPGAGSAAEPGVSDQQQQSPEEGAPGEGSSDQGSGSSSDEGGGDPDAQSEQGDGTGGTSPGEGDSQQGGSSAEQQDMSGNPDDETDASQGSGAGTGQSNANDQDSGQAPEGPTDASELTPEADTPGEGEAGDPPPSREERGEEDDGTGTDSGGSSSLQLEGTSDNGIQSGSDSGSSSLGSGSGSSTASGDETQTDVGVAGPDSNRVPDSLRDVVKDYFEGPEP